MRIPNICGALSVITNNVTYVHLTKIFGNNLDDVHPSKYVNHTTADFIINLLSKKLKATTHPAQHRLLGASCLAWRTSTRYLC